MKTGLVLFLTLFTLAPLVSLGQPNSYSFPELDSLLEIEERPIVIFIHTDWCRYCQAMKKTTFKDQEVIDRLNDQFWFAEFDGEQEQDITFLGRTFKFKPTGRKTGVHELAEQLGTIDGQVAYPILCILNTNYEIVFQYNQFLSAADLTKVLAKVAED